MVAAGFPVPGTRFGAKALSGIRKAIASASGRALSPHKASLARLTEMPLSVLGFGGVDFAAWHLGHGWGWLVTGLSLFVAETMIADDDGPGPA